jgi:hypothetical protein
LRRRDAELRRQQIFAGLVHGAAFEPTYERACRAAAAHLRRQGIRPTQEELDQVARMTVREALFPPCDCMHPDSTALPFELGEVETPGPHHGAHCPRWRQVRP